MERLVITSYVVMLWSYVIQTTTYYSGNAMQFVTFKIAHTPISLCESCTYVSMYLVLSVCGLRIKHTLSVQAEEGILLPCMHGVET